MLDTLAGKNNMYNIVVNCILKYNHDTIINTRLHA